MNRYYSNIYWHFLGSPKNIDWTRIYSPKEILAYGKPKEEKECFEILDKILKSKRLLAKSVEKIDDKYTSDSFCCVTDIPAQSLKEHVRYYGNFAIGFKHGKIQTQFNPVLYIKKDSLKKITKISAEQEFAQNSSWNLLMQTYNVGRYIFRKLGIAKGNVDEVGKVDASELGPYIHNHFKITSFSQNPDETFYREREWRKNGDFLFDYTDIAAILIPNKYLPSTFETLKNYQIDNVAILTWELLDEI